MLHATITQIDSPAEQRIYLNQCYEHPNMKLYLPLGVDFHLSEFRCFVCHPPPAKAFIAQVRTPRELDRIQERINAGLVIAGQSVHQPGRADGERAGGEQIKPTPTITINYCRPACPHCHCSWIMEVDVIAFTELRCWHCNEALTENQINEFQLSNEQLK